MSDKLETYISIFFLYFLDFSFRENLIFHVFRRGDRFILRKNKTQILVFDKVV